MALCLLSRNSIWLDIFLDSMAVVPCARAREPGFVLCGLAGGGVD